MCNELSRAERLKAPSQHEREPPKAETRNTPQGRDQLPQLRSEGFHLIKENQKASLRIEAVPIWLRRWALLQLAVRKGEYWEMRSLGVIKAPHSAPLPGWGWLLSSRQQLLSSRYGEQGSGAGSTAGHPCLGTALPGAGSAGTAQLVPFPSLHSARVGAHPCPQGLGEPVPTQDLQSRVGGQAQALAILRS